MNDCIYGHDIQANIIQLTLLRSPGYPDPAADAGQHHFVYSLFPHTGSWETGTQAQAYGLNDPLIVYPAKQPGAARQNIQSFIQVSAPNVVIETVKCAEDGDGVIVRLYESQRRRGPVFLRCAFDLAQACETNLLEENLAPLPFTGNCVSLQLRPFQIMTIRVSFQ